MSRKQNARTLKNSGIPTEPNGRNHSTPAFSNAAAMQETHANAMLNAAKALTFASVSTLDDDKFYAEVT